MKTFVVFSRGRRVALRQFQALFVAPSEVGMGEVVVSAPDGWAYGDDLEGLALVSTPSGLAAVVDPAVSLSTARELAIESIRATARALLEQLDIRHNARLGELRIDRTDPARIEAYYRVLLEQEQVRKSSNAAQDAASAAATASAAWAVVDALNLHSAPLGQPGQNITQYALLSRMALTPSEKASPYIAAMQADLLALDLVSLPLMGIELQKLVQAGVFTQARVDAVVNAPIQWVERKTDF